MEKNASDLLVVVAEYPQILSITTGVPIGINARCLFLNLLCELAVLLILQRSDWLMKFAVVQRKTRQTIPSRFPKGWIEQWENKESQSAQVIFRNSGGKIATAQIPFQKKQWTMASTWSIDRFGSRKNHQFKAGHAPDMKYPNQGAQQLDHAFGCPPRCTLAQKLP